jgi:hypothetical protein
LFSFPNSPKRYQYAPIRFFEREFGLEYTKFEYTRKLEIHTAKVEKSKEVAGYVVWVKRKNAFLIVPTLTSPEPYIYCEIPDWMDSETPPERSFIIAKGKWTYKTRFKEGGTVTTQIFIAEYYKTIKPDLQAIKPDIKYKDFKGILFDALQNVDDPVQDLVSHSLVSSPKALGRLGGITLSLYNESRGTSRHLLAHLRRFLPKEFLRPRATYSLQVEEISHSVRLDPFPWMYKSVDADTELSNETLSLMRRSPDTSAPDEFMISLHSQNTQPKSLRDPPAAISDVPIVVADALERKTDKFYDTTPEILKFIIATHLSPVTMSEEMRKASLDAIHQSIHGLTSRHEEFRWETVRGGILDMNIHGKPLSLQHLILTDGRSNVESEIKMETVSNALKIFAKNMDDTLTIWGKGHRAKGEVDFTWVSPEEREIVGFIYDHGPSAKVAVSEHCHGKMTGVVFERSWKELYDHGTIYEKDTGIFDIIPFRKENN